MYPLKVVVVGQGDVIQRVRLELANQFIPVESAFPDAKEAIAALRLASGDKQLLMLHLKSSQDIEGLKRLSAAFAGWPILVLVDPGENDGSSSEMILTAMRAGAGQVVLLPLRADDFRSAMDCFADQVVYAARDKTVIAVAGVTGGCGGTTLAVNLAYEIANVLGRRCILADLSLTMGKVASSLNIEPRHTIKDLIRDVRRVDIDLVQQVLVKYSENLEILAGPEQIIAPASNSAQDVLQVVHFLKQMADVVVLDVPSTFNDLYFEVLANAGQVVMVCEQKIPSIRALKLIREALGRTGPDDWEFLAINRYDPKAHGFTVADLSSVLQVKKWSTIADDPIAVVSSVNHGLPIRLKAPNSRVLNDIDALACTLLGVDYEPGLKPKNKGIFGRMQRAFTHS